MSKYRRPNPDEGPTDMLGFPTPVDWLRDAAQGAPRALKLARRAQEASGAEGSYEPWGILDFGRRIERNMSEIVRVSPKVNQASTLNVRTSGPGILRMACFLE